nr:MAG TPA: hypothetical protein [Caudoviricetes sp.]
MLFTHCYRAAYKPAGGLQHLSILQQSFTLPSATPRACESLVPGVQELHHSQS